MEICIKGGLEDKIAFLGCLIVFIIAVIVYKIKWWWEDKKGKGGKDENYRRTCKDRKHN